MHFFENTPKYRCPDGNVIEKKILRKRDADRMRNKLHWDEEKTVFLEEGFAADAKIAIIPPYYQAEETLPRNY